MLDEPSFISAPRPCNERGAMRRTTGSAGLYIALALGVLCVIGGGAWYALQYPQVQNAVGMCPKQDYLSQVQPIAQEWDDAANLASSTPRMSLPIQIARLQEVRRKAQVVIVYDCTRPAHEALLGAMDRTIVAYTDFLAQKPEKDVQDRFTAAADLMKTFTKEMQQLATK